MLCFILLGFRGKIDIQSPFFFYHPHAVSFCREDLLPVVHFQFKLIPGHKVQAEDASTSGDQDGLAVRCPGQLTDPTVVIHNLAVGITRHIIKPKLAHPDVFPGSGIDGVISAGIEGKIAHHGAVDSKRANVGKVFVRYGYPAAVTFIAIEDHPFSARVFGKPFHSQFVLSKPLQWLHLHRRAVALDREQLVPPIIQKLEQQGAVVIQKLQIAQAGLAESYLPDLTSFAWHEEGVIFVPESQQQFVRRDRERAELVAHALLTDILLPEVLRYLDLQFGSTAGFIKFPDAVEIFKDQSVVLPGHGNIPG